MRVMLSENVTHFHEVELSDELDIEQILNTANKLIKNYDNAEEIISEILQIYKDKFNFDYVFLSNSGGTKIENIELESIINS